MTTSTDPTSPRRLFRGRSAALVGIILLTACAPAVPPVDSPEPTSANLTSPVPRVTAPSPSPAPFSWESRPATADDALTWRPECPVAIGDLVVVDFTHWTFEGGVAAGELVINRDIEAAAREAFADLYDQGFPIRSATNVDAFGGSDDASMAADNTSAYNCRYAVADGDPTWSRHAYGRAIDINPVENPYVFHGEALPPDGAAFADRDGRPGMLVVGGDALTAFLDAGFTWGGAWSNPDYQHVEVRG